MRQKPDAINTWYGLPQPQVQQVGDRYFEDNDYHLGNQEPELLPEDPEDDFEGIEDEIDEALDPTKPLDKPGDEGDKEEWNDWRKAYNEQLITLSERLKSFRARGYENVHHSELRTALELCEWEAAQPADHQAEQAAANEQEGLHDRDEEIGINGQADYQELEDDELLNNIVAEGLRNEDNELDHIVEQGIAEEAKDFSINLDQEDEDALDQAIDLEHNQEEKHDGEHNHILEPDELLDLLEEEDRLRDQLIHDALMDLDADAALDVIAGEAENQDDFDDLELLQEIVEQEDLPYYNDYDSLTYDERRAYWRNLARPSLGEEEGKEDGASYKGKEYDFHRKELIDGDWNRSTYVSTLLATGFKPQIDLTKRGKAPPALVIDTPKKQAYVDALKEAKVLTKGDITFGAPHHFRELGDSLRLIFNGEKHGEATKKPPPKFHMHSHKHIRRMAAKYAFGAKFDLKNAFFTLKIHEDFRHCFGIRLPDGTYYYEVLPMGYNWCPFICHIVIDQMVQHLRRQGIEISHYMDDIYIFGDTEAQVNNELKHSIKSFEDIGWRISAKKTRKAARAIARLVF
jgi:hypothetical protein